MLSITLQPAVVQGHSHFERMAENSSNLNVNQLRRHMEFYRNLPVGSRKTVSLTVLFERYDSACHTAVLSQLKRFCSSSAGAPCKMDVRDLDRHEGGFQFELKTDNIRPTKDDALTDFVLCHGRLEDDEQHTMHAYDTSSTVAFESKCQIRYGVGGGDTKYGEAFGKAMLVTFFAFENIPWWVMVQLENVLSEKKVKHLTGKTKVVSSTGMPPEHDIVWLFSNTNLI